MVVEAAIVLVELELVEVVGLTEVVELELVEVVGLTEVVVVGLTEVVVVVPHGQFGHHHGHCASAGVGNTSGMMSNNKYRVLIFLMGGVLLY
jgi:hypothetical protein